MNDVIIRRGDIYYADLRPVVGSEQGGVRPVLIIQMTWETSNSPTVTMCGHYIQDEQSQAAHPCGAAHQALCHD